MRVCVCDGVYKISFKKTQFNYKRITDEDEVK